LNPSEKYNTNLRTFISKYDEIKNQHRGEFIAMFDEDIIGESGHETLLEKIDRRSKILYFESTCQKLMT
jgi:hypothetical protein